MEAVVPFNAWMKYVFADKNRRDSISELTFVESFLNLDGTVGIKGFENEEEVSLFLMTYA